MRRALTLIFVVLTAIVLTIPSAVVVNGDGAQGRILAGANANGADGVEVSAYAYTDEGPGDFIDSGTTDSDGRFALGLLNPGSTYYLKIDMPDYEINEELLKNDVYLTFIRFDVVTLKVPSDGTAVNIFMSPTLGTVSGIVRNADGDPLSGARVDYDGVEKGSVFTDDKGMYIIDGENGNGIHVGEYRITAGHNGYKSQTVTLDVKRGTQADTVDFGLDVNKAEYIFGLDLAHSVMIFCGLVGFLMIVLTILYRVRLEEHDNIDVDETWEEFDE